MTLTVPLDTPRVRAILLDIEGTTTPIDFVTKVLFPYARQRTNEFLRHHRDNPEVGADIEALRREYSADFAQKLNPPTWRDDSLDAELESAVAYLHWQMDRDRKSTPLKSLQGKIWEAGYRTGELRGEVFPDVPPAFSRWRGQKKDICIFSSGSILAQKLLFTHSTAGDLTSFLRAHFDTTTGHKKEAESYRRIAKALDLEPQGMVFLSDVTEELDASRLAGMETVLCVRPGNPQTASTPHPVIRSFDELFP